MSAPVSVVTPLKPLEAASGKRSEPAGASSSSSDIGACSVYHSSPTSFDIIEASRETSRLGAMRSGVLTSARCIEERLAEESRPYRLVLITLTYARPGEWSPDHVGDFLDCFREWLRRRGHPLLYVWVMEIQEQRYRDTGDAVPHYHMLVWLPAGVEFPNPDDQGWWKHGMSRTDSVWSSVGMLHYLTKYLTKGGLMHLFPRGARIWGAGGLSSALLVKRRFLRLPQYLREVIAEPGEILRCVRVKAGGWWIPGRGMWVRRSPYRVDRYSWTHVLLQWVGWQPGDIQYREQWYDAEPAGVLC